MIVKTLLFLITLLAVFSAEAQLSVNWYKTSGNLNIYNPKRSVYNTTDSCIYTAGMFSGQFEMDGLSLSSSFPKAFFLMKTKGNGEIVWLKKIAESDYNVELTSNVAIALAPSGDLLLGITFNRKLFFGSDSTILPDDSFTTGGMLFKLDTSGIELWDRQVFATNIQSIAVNQNQDVFLTGVNMSGDVYLSSYSQTSDSLWTRTGGSSSGADEGKQIQIDEDGNVYLVGFIDPNGGVYFDTAHPTFVSPYFWGSFLAKYNPSGQIQWVRCFYSSSFGNYVVSQSIAIIGDRVMVVGAFQGGIVKFYPSSATLNSSNTALTSFILCYDGSGNLIWKKKPHNIPTGSGSVGIDLGISVNNHLICKSTFDPWVMIGNDTLFTSGVNDIFLEEFDTLGNSIWHKQIFGANMDGATSFFKAEDDLVLNISTKSTSLLVDNTTMTLAPVSDQMVLVRFNYETLGLDENGVNEFSVFPNPNNGNWSIKTHHNITGTYLKVYSVSGELVYEQLLGPGNLHQMNTLLPSGVYLIQIKEGGKPIRLIIQ